MKKSLILTCLFLAALIAHSQTNVLYGYVRTFGLQVNTNVDMELYLLSPVNRTWNGYPISNDPVYSSEDTNGYFSFTNVLWGKYKLRANDGSGTAWTVTVPATLTNPVPIASLIGNAALPPDPATNYYTQAQVDALIAGVSGVTEGPTTNTSFSAVWSNTVEAIALTTAQTWGSTGTVASANSVTGAVVATGGNVVTNGGNPAFSSVTNTSGQFTETTGQFSFKNNSGATSTLNDGDWIVTGGYYAGVHGFNGSGAGLISLPAPQLTGQVPAAALSATTNGSLPLAKYSDGVVTNTSDSTLGFYSIGPLASSISHGNLQGVAFTGTNQIDCATALLSLRPTNNLNVILATNSWPAGSTYDHFGDGDVYGRWLYVPMQLYPTSEGIGVYNAATLQCVNNFDITSVQSEISAIAVNDTGSALYAANYQNGYIYKYLISNETNLTFVSSNVLNPPMCLIQGLELKGNTLFVLGDVNMNAANPAYGSLWSYDLNTWTGQRIALLSFTNATEWEGLGMTTFAGDANTYLVCCEGATGTQNYYPLVFKPNTSPGGLINSQAPFLHWTFDESPTNIVGVDGNSVEGSISSGVKTNGLFSKGLAVRGAATSYCTDTKFTVGMLPLSAITVSFWVLVTTNTTQVDAPFVNIWSGGANMTRFFLTCRNTTGSWLRWGTMNAAGSTTYVDTGSPSYIDGNWHNLVGTYDGASNRLYMDGKFLGSTAQTGALNRAPLPFRIGEYNGTASSITPGIYDEVEIWSYALTDAQILANYQALAASVNVPTPWGITTNFTDAASHVWKFTNGLLKSFQ